MIIRRYVASAPPASLRDELNIQYSALYSLRERRHRSTNAMTLTCTKLHGDRGPQTSTEQSAPWLSMCVSCCDRERRPLTFGSLFVPLLLHGDVTDYVCITTQRIEHESPTASPHFPVLCVFQLATASNEAEWEEHGLFKGTVADPRPNLTQLRCAVARHRK